MVYSAWSAHILRTTFRHVQAVTTHAVDKKSQLLSSVHLNRDPLTLLYCSHRVYAMRSQHNLTTGRSEEHTSELQSRQYLVCRLLLEKKKNRIKIECADHRIETAADEKQAYN